ncbi:MAG: GNAT family N-acetyltransferase [Thalassobaculum sp.]|uniref:GNAT family N-acetyltransferase n=1 Tax=Thalassobaculum sp. TaxID=2022740 RepID=UPI0032EEA704
MTIALPECRIVWDPLDSPAWDEAFAGIRRSNLLQSAGYARAVCPPKGQRPRRGRILIDGEPAGLFQIQEAQILWRAIHAVILDRGPLWLDGHGGPAHVAAFFRAFDAAVPRRIGRRRRILPEVSDTPEMRAALDGTRLRRRSGSVGYQTVWVDLRPEPEALRAGLKGKWRAELAKGEKSGLATDWSWSGATLPRLLKGYERDRTARGYPGPEPRTVAELCRALLPERRVLAGTAALDGRPVAAVLLFGHGGSATYQIGWTTPDGRDARAGHLLLWQAMERLREAGYRDLDLGGVNDAEARGVKTFKSGLGGETVTLVGQYE